MKILAQNREHTIDERRIAFDIDETPEPAVLGPVREGPFTMSAENNILHITMLPGHGFSNAYIQKIEAGVAAEEAKHRKRLADVENEKRRALNLTAIRTGLPVSEGPDTTGLI